MQPSFGRQSLAEFEETFSDEPRCAEYIFKQRWRDDFECPGCGGGRAALLKSRAFTYECRDCRRQTSITAGTVMHRSKLPLTMWFSAAYLLATHPLGISTRQLQERLGIT
jgi:transposase-like protein